MTYICVWWNINIKIGVMSDGWDVINCQFREFAAALSGTVHFLSPDQQSGIHCRIICAIQLLTVEAGLESLPDIRNVIALEVLRNHALQIDIYLLTYLLTYWKDILPSLCDWPVAAYSSTKFSVSFLQILQFHCFLERVIVDDMANNRLQQRTVTCALVSKQHVAGRTFTSVGTVGVYTARVRRTSIDNRLV